MKKGLKILIGVTSGVALMGTIFGALYGLNSNVRNWVDNAVVKVSNDIPEEYKDVEIESKLALTSEQLAAQGLQVDEEVDPEFKLKFALKNLPTDFDKDSTLVTKVIQGNPADIYFKSGTAKSFNSITHENGADFSFHHNAFEETGKSAKYLIKTYWASYPDIFINTEITFKSDFDNQASNPMTMLNTANLPRSFADQNGLQIYEDTPAYALLAPKVTNRKSSVSADALIGNKVVYGDATKVTFENVVSGQAGPIAISKSGDFVVVKHSLFTETDKVENYVVRSYLIQDESCYIDTAITFKSDFEEDSEKADDEYEVSFIGEDEDDDYSEIVANSSNKAEFELTCVSDDVDQPVLVRFRGTDDAPVAKITVGNKVYRNGVGEVEDGDTMVVTFENVAKSKTYEYVMEYISLEDQNVILSEEITVFGNSVTRSAPRMVLRTGGLLGSEGTAKTATITATLTPANATLNKIDWFVSDAAITLSKTSSVSGEEITMTAAAPFNGEIHVTAKASVNYNLADTCVVVYAA